MSWSTILQGLLQLVGRKQHRAPTQGPEDYFPEALRFTLGPNIEGGYTIDNGGPTYRGVTQHEYDRWRADRGLPRRDVRQVEEQEIRDLYRDDYWEPAYCPEMPRVVAIAHFDAAVNSGPVRAIQFLQRALGVADDGRFGAQTRAALAKMVPAEAAQRMIDARYVFLRSITQHEDPHVRWNGYRRRLALLREYLGVG